MVCFVFLSGFGRDLKSVKRRGKIERELIVGNEISHNLLHVLRGDIGQWKMRQIWSGGPLVL